MEMDDGTIIPSFFDVHDNKMEPMQREMHLRVGVIIASYDPTDNNNISKKFMEYDVQTYHLQHGTYSPITYPRCYIYDLFGSKADYVEYTLRPSTLVNNSQSPSQNSLELGSNVLLLCINGIKNQGIIIGGIKNSQKAAEDPSLGHHFIWQFNGINSNVNQNGELIVTFNGATQADGTLSSSANSDASGTYLKIDQNGVATISSKDSNVSVIVDRTSNTMDITGNGQVNISSANGNVVIKSNGVLTGAATDATILGTTYRAAESVMNSTLAAQLSTLGTTLTGVASSLASAAGALGGNAGLAAAAATLGGTVISLNTMAAAISNFEAQAASFLSKKNISD